MKKATLLLLSIFLLIGFCVNAFSAGTASIDTPSPTPLKVRETTATTGVREGGGAEDLQKRVLREVSEIEQLAKNLPPNGPRKDDRANLIREIQTVKLQLTGRKPASPETVENIQRQLPEFRERHRSLKNPLTQANIASDPTPTATPEPTQSPKPTTVKEQNEPFNLWEWVIYGVVGLVILAGIGVGIYFLLKYREQEKAKLQGSFNSLKARDKELGIKLEGFQKVVTDLSQQVAQQKSEILKLKQGLATQSAASPSFSTPAFDVPREQPRFPVAVDDYLTRIGQAKRPVKYDYKERLLVMDPTEEGNLLLVQDEGRLYVVPSFTTLSTKSDYTTYLERYYNCAKPMAGTIWIREPAGATKSGTGWQITSKGDLEVR